MASELEDRSGGEGRVTASGQASAGVGWAGVVGF